MEYQKITKISKNSQQNNSETVSSENDKSISKGIPKERYISSDNNGNNSIIMEYQKITNLLDNTADQPSKFKTKNWVEKIKSDSKLQC